MKWLSRIFRSRFPFPSNGRPISNLGTREVSRLLKSKSDLNIRGSDGATPLTVASTYGHADLVRSLLAAGADVNFCDSAQRSALEHAVLRTNTEIAQHLVEAGADAASLDRALALAILSRQKKIVRILKSAGARFRRHVLSLGSEIWPMADMIAAESD